MIESARSVEEPMPAASPKPAFRYLAWILGLTAVFVSMEGGPRNAFHNAVPITVGLKQAVLFLLGYFGSVVGFLVLLTTESRFVRWPTYALSWVSFATNLSFLWIVKVPYGVPAAELVLDAIDTRREISQSLSMYRAEAVLFAMAGLLLTAALALASRRTLPSLRPIWLWIPAASISLAAWVLLSTRGAISEIPMVFKVPLVTIQARRARVEVREKDAPRFAPRHAPRAERVLFLVDESVTGSALSINGFAKETTPYLEEIADRYLNLGVASSGGNRSSLSNHILLSGLQLGDVPDLNMSSLRDPTVFQYAKAAGYSTHFLTAEFNNSGYMSKEDHAFIDHTTVIESFPLYRRDYELADRLARILHESAAQDRRAFIYANKIGAHYHYEYSYPKEETVFQPTASYPRWFHLIPAWDIRKLENSYYNGIRWSVDGFFKYFLSKIEGLDVLIVYVSDHGQTMPTRLEPSTHATVNDPPSRQADVPLLIFDLGPRVKASVAPLLEVAKRSVNRASLFSLFGSMLVFLGYDKEEVARHYGTTLFDEQPQPRHFISGNCFGKGAWRKNVFSTNPP